MLFSMPTRVGYNPVAPAGGSVELGAEAMRASF